MILSAALLDTFDRCERRFAFEREFEPISISPLGVLYSAVEEAICSADPEQSAKDVTMSIAQSRELQLDGQSSFNTIRHVGLLGGIIAVALQERFGKFRRVPSTPNWVSGLYLDASSTPHRIELVSHWDDDRLRSTAHSWRVIGELAALSRPLTLTAGVIGPQRGGRRHSEWSQGFLHPQSRALRFARRHDKHSGFSEGWEKVWREYQAEIPTRKWLEVMKQDGVLDPLIISREIAFNPTDHRMIAARREMDILRVMMEGASEKSPMRRSSCDETGRGACPFQSVCYSPIETDPLRLLHLYRIRPQGMPEAAPAEYTCLADIAASPNPLEGVRTAPDRHRGRI